MLSKKSVASFLAICMLGLLATAQVSGADDAPKKKGANGTVKAVDTDASTITLTMKNKKEMVDKTFAVAKDAKILIDGESKSLADVKVGATARLGLSEDGNSATRIVVGERKKKQAN